MSKLIKVFLIFCVGWQSLAFAGFDALVADADEKQHALLHFQDVAHHHDDHAEDFHQDNSSASNAHCLSDACQFSLALLTPQFSLSLLAGTYYHFIDRLIPSGQLLPGGLERPPKPMA